MLEQNQNSAERNRYVAAVVAAEFPNVKAEGDSYRLKGMFAALANELERLNSN